MKPKAIVLLSGGLDSAVCARIAQTDGFECIALSLRYGQRHQREIEAAQTLVQKFGIAEHHVLSVNLAQWGGSALTDPKLDVPNTGLQPQIIPSTYVPGRNTVFIAIALSLAEAKLADAIYLGINAVDYSGYPDCRPEYLSAFQTLANLASKAGIEGKAPQLVAPLVQLTKVEIVRKALQLDVPIAETWSCYLGAIAPCGTCDSCRIRDRALIDAERPDLATPQGRAFAQTAQQTDGQY